MSAVTMRQTAAGPTCTPRPGSGPRLRSPSSWSCSWSSTSPSRLRHQPGHPPALLGAKLGVQARSMHTVDRARLRVQLDTATEARLVLVSAPAGFGKSTLLADWMGQEHVRGAWLALDARDNDIVRFARYLAAATARLVDATEDGTELDAASFDPELVLVGILERLAAAGSGVVLVLDDYHVIEEPAVHRLVTTLVERLPPGARLAIATRADPPMPLARLRARGGPLAAHAARPLPGRARRPRRRSAGAAPARRGIPVVHVRCRSGREPRRLAAGRLAVVARRAPAPVLRADRG